MTKGDQGTGGGLGTGRHRPSQAVYLFVSPPVSIPF